MTSDEEPGVASDATGTDAATLATPTLPIVNSHPPDTSDDGVAGDATLTALADDLEYTLTVGQALERMMAAGRKAPSGRSLQRYCIEGRLAAKKIRTVFGAEWLINETSLAQLIEMEPIVTGDAGDANRHRCGDAGDANPADSQFNSRRHFRQWRRWRRHS